jgi:hypothetical protein
MECETQEPTKWPFVNQHSTQMLRTWDFPIPSLQTHISLSQGGIRAARTISTSLSFGISSQPVRRRQGNFCRAVVRRRTQQSGSTSGSTCCTPTRLETPSQLSQGRQKNSKGSGRSQGTYASDSRALGQMRQPTSSSAHNITTRIRKRAAC